MKWQTREGAEAVSLAAVIYSSFTVQKHSPGQGGCGAVEQLYLQIPRPCYRYSALGEPVLWEAVPSKMHLMMSIIMFCQKDLKRAKSAIP